MNTNSTQTTEANPKYYYSIKEISERISKSQNTIRDWVISKKIVGIQDSSSGKYWINRAQAELLFEYNGLPPNIRDGEEGEAMPV